MNSINEYEKYVGIDKYDHLETIMRYVVCPVPGKKKYGTRGVKCPICSQSLNDNRWNFCPKCGSRILKTDLTERD